MLPYDIAAIRSLQAYLQEEISQLNKVYDEWPYHGEEMDLPCASIITQGQPEYTNLRPYEYSSEGDLVREVYAQIDGRLQVDIFAEYKIQRSEVLQLVTNALNKQNINEDLPNGLSLTMTDYYDVIARYDQVGYTYMDTEDNSQKSQWRVKIDILFSHVLINEKTVSRMNDIRLINNISENDNFDVEENYQV